MKIYHYTSLDNLALILKHRTLRFNNAKNVDDPEEAETMDIGSLKDYLFISCWTNSSDENIPLWKMYANQGRGIRLEVDTEYINFNGKETPLNGIFIVVENVIKEKDEYYFINYWHHYKKGGLTHFFEMNYSDDIRNFYKVITKEHLQFQIENAFNTKKKCWQFQNEIRFILLGCSADDDTICDNWQLIFNNIISKKPFSSNHVDLKLSNDFFSNLVIRQGPLTTESDDLILKSLLDSNKDVSIAVEKSIIKLK